MPTWWWLRSNRDQKHVTYVTYYLVNNPRFLWNGDLKVRDCTLDRQRIEMDRLQTKIQNPFCEFKFTRTCKNGRFHPKTCLKWIFIWNNHLIYDFFSSPFWNHVIGQPIRVKEMGEILSYVSNNSLCLSKNRFSVNVTQWSNLSTLRHHKIIEHF